MNLLEHAYLEGVKAATDTFKAPAPPVHTTASTTPASPSATPPKTISSPGAVMKPEAPMMPGSVPNPAQNLSQMSMEQGHITSFNVGAKLIPDQVNPNVKLSGFKLSGFNIGMHPEPKAPAGTFEPDNGEHPLGTNFDQMPSRSVSEGFDALRTQKNVDFVNAGNEAAFTSPTGLPL